MANFSVHVPDDFVVIVTPRVDEHCLAFEATNIGIKLLAYYGKANVAALTGPEKAAFSAQIHFWKLNRDAHVSESAQAAYVTAEQEADDAFNP